MSGHAVVKRLSSGQEFGIPEDETFKTTTYKPILRLFL
jgi:hypothetical protein